ncbi:phage tail sheath family protein [Natrarchaeobius halalkaliphilus]|uniref:Phage tail sheath family protein n=1 Tax=Natrarchaeobius halalkaliphilus TaxID=1679091 RepID=A0A3N6LZ57_9EURY|nr:phage tail sheath subtilisin-like domain-containing protein [Natrarchaeobius halalkaliphilus]RQG88013.1 phage tail sheath family protein [Natrarchaeobius halalkaliphilus]
MPEYLSPGVYVEETEGSKSVEGVSTSTAGFLGQTERGPLKPQLVTGFNDYKRKFGGYVDDSFLTHAIDGFFKNGGSRAFVGRVTDASRSDVGTATLSNDDGDDVIGARAVGPGDWGGQVAVTVTDAPMSASDNTVFGLTVRYWSDADPDDVEDPDGDEPDPMPTNEERFDEINADEGSTQYYESAIEGSSNFIEIEKLGDGRPENQTVWLKIASTDGGVNGGENGADGGDDDGDDGGEGPDLPDGDELEDMTKDELVEVAEELDVDTDQNKPELLEEVKAASEAQLLTDGGDGVTVGDYEGDGTPGQRTGLAAFEEISNISIVCAPDENDVPGLTEALVAHCENMKERIAVLQAEQNPDPVADHETPADSTYAAYYYPWINVMHPEKGVQELVPPGGHVAGIYARNDNEGGVHEAPANMVVRGAMSLQVDLTKAEQDILNPKGINCIRSFQGRGIRVWGARTTSSDPEWKYVNVRRLFLFLKQSIDEGTQWAVFEPNDQDLWARVTQTIEQYLTTQWRDGALMGTSASEAFYVDCGKGSTMTQDDIDNGRLICEIGVAPVKPAEFVIFRIGQWTGDS